MFRNAQKLFYFLIYFCICHCVAVSTMIPEPKLPLSLQKVSLSLFLSPKIAALQKRAKHSKKSEFHAADSTAGLTKHNPATT